MQGMSDSTQDAPSWLLELPAGVLPPVLQQLDQRSLASLSATCSTLRHAVPAHLSKLEVFCKTPVMHASFNEWLHLYSPSLTNLEQCSVVVIFDLQYLHIGIGAPRLPSVNMPHQLPQLRQLHLHGVMVQLGPSGLDGCPGLTALDLESCTLESFAATFAALSGLQSLRLASTLDLAGHLPLDQLLRELQHASQLTHLSLDFKGPQWCRPLIVMTPPLVKQLSQLSALTSLQHLDLGYVPSSGWQGGFPCQLVGLTSLQVSYQILNANSIPTAEQFQLLSALTALHELSVISTTVRDSTRHQRLHCRPSSMPGIASLSLLTSLELELDAVGLQFNTVSSEGWTRMTALQHLALHNGTVQPEALAVFTQLHALRLDGVATPAGQQLKDMFIAVAQLSLLTELSLSGSEKPLPWDVVYEPPTAAAFTALTVSTNLCTLQVGFVGQDVGPCIFFRPGLAYPSLRLIDLRYFGVAVGVPLSEQQLQQLCSCCPALESLDFTLCAESSATALQPLLQLSALTSLKVCPSYNMSESLAMSGSLMSMQRDAKAAAATAAAAAAAAAGKGAGAVSVAAQLTGIKQLALEFKESPKLTDPVLLQLTALTALEQLRLRCYTDYGYNPNRDDLLLVNKARPGNDSDVWIQLSHHLECSTAAAAAAASTPAGPRLPQLSSCDNASVARGNSSSGPDGEALEALLPLLRATAVFAEPPAEVVRVGEVEGVLPEASEHYSSSLTDAFYDVYSDAYYDSGTP